MKMDNLDVKGTLTVAGQSTLAGLSAAATSLGSLAVNGQTSLQNLTINGAITATAGGIVPTGSIIMWSGSGSKIPAGWALCDGTNGTPDLRNRFIVGASGKYLVGGSGGEEEVALESSQMPRHAHNAKDTTYIEKYSHVQEKVGFNKGYYGTGVEKLDSSYVGLSGWGADRDNNGRVYKSTTTSDVGEGRAHNNIPPYYALAFIMSQPPQVVISSINYRGAVERTERDEYVEISNQGNAAANLSGWRINAGAPDQNFEFPAGTVLEAGQSYRVYTNEIHPETGGFSFGSKQALWRNAGDTGTLYNASGQQVDQYSYGDHAG